MLIPVIFIFVLCQQIRSHSTDKIWPTLLKHDTIQGYITAVADSKSPNCLIVNQNLTRCREINIPDLKNLTTQTRLEAIFVVGTCVFHVNC